MSDRAPGSVTVFTCPESSEAKVLEVLNEAGLSEEYSGSPDSTELKLGEQYVDWEASLDMDTTVGEKLVELGCAFEAQVDPKYEWMGSVFLHVPGLGTFSGEAGPDGLVTVDAAEIDKACDAAVSDVQERLVRGATCVELLGQLVHGLEQLTGRRVREAIAKLRQEASDGT